MFNIRHCILHKGVDNYVRKVQRAAFVPIYKANLSSNDHKNVQNISSSVGIAPFRECICFVGQFIVIGTKPSSFLVGGAGI